MTDKLTQLVDRITQGELSSRGKRQLERHDGVLRSAGEVERLSEVEGRQLPTKYHALYNRLLRSQPLRAKYLWRTMSYVPQPERSGDTKAIDALIRVQQGNQLRRRI